LFVGDSSVADGVAAAVDADLRLVGGDDMAVRAALDAGDFDGVLVEDGVAGATDLVSKIADDDGAPDVLFVTADRQGVDDALDAGAADYVRVDDPPRVVRRRVRAITPDLTVRYRTLVEAVGDPMYVLDEGGEVTMANEAMADHLGYDRTQILGTHASEFAADEDYERGTQLLRDLYEDDERDWTTYEMESVTADGERIYTENNVAVLTDEEGNYEGSVGVIRDISERKRRNEALRRQNERLDEFASVVSHDLRNPLNVVQGHLELAQETGVERHFGVIEQEIDRVEMLLDELLALAREGKVVSDPETVSLVEVAQAAWDGVSTGGATLELPESDPTVDADETRLRELFENLFRNAVEHAGPDVTVRVGTTEAGFYVADDGPGIPESDRERVFDRGYTTTDDGTGLGLDIVQRIADGHGWTVSVAASEHGGHDDHATLLRGSGVETERSTLARTAPGRGGARFEFRTSVSHR